MYHLSITYLPSTIKYDVSRERPSDLQQILTEYNEEHALRAIRKQHQTAGEARSKTINDFPFGAAIAQVLKDFEFPAH